MAKRIYPIAGLFENISELTPNRIVYTDPTGQIIDLRIGNNLQVNNGQLDVVLSASIFVQTEATNIGTGEGLFSFRDGNTLKFKSLSGNSKVLFSGDSENLTINVVDVADYNHVHLISEITGLQTALDSKSNVNHIHSNATQSTSGFLSNTDKIAYDDAVTKSNFLYNVENDRDSCGVVEGGVITLTGGIGYQVTAGRGYIRDNNGLMVAISWPTLTGQTTIAGDNFIFLDNTGNLTCRSVKNNYDLIFLGYIATDSTNTTVYGFSSNRFPYKQFHAKLAAYLESTLGVVIERGFDVSVDTNLNVLCGEGVVWADLNEFSFPNITTFRKFFVDNTGSYILDSSTTPNILSTQYWNDISRSGSLALQPMPVGHYKKDCLFISTRGNLYYQYGVSTYASFNDVLLAQPPVVNPSSTNIAVIAEIIVQEGNPSFSYVIDARPLFSRLWSGDMLRDFAQTIPHHILQGLTDDDHPQYLTNDRGDARYYTKTLLDGGQLDVRYYTETEIDSKLSLKSNTNHGHSTATAITDGFMSFSDYIKLSNIQNNATQNSTDSYLLDRTHHTGTQDVSTITGLTKSSVGLSNVDNTSDINKPISTATQTALDTKVDKITGKGLSTNDFTNNDKSSVDFSRTSFDDFGSAVNISGGTISLTGGVNFSISPGVGYARNNLGTFVRVAWSTLSGTCTNAGDNFINVDYQGNIVITTTAEQGDYIALGYIRTALSNTVVVGFSNVRLIGYNHLFNLGELFRSTIGSLVQSGCSTAMQPAPNELKLIVGSGFIWTLLNRFQINDSSTFTKLFNTSDFQFVVDSSTTPNTVNTALWNNASNPAASALVPMTTGYYKKDMIALTPEGQVFYIYGTSEHATLDEAKQAPVPAVPDSIKLSVVRSAALVVQQGATSVDTLLDTRPMFNRLFDTGQAASNATVISHSNLIDLLNDDHPQYLTTGRGDARYYRKTELDSGSLDFRYYTETEIDALLANKSNVGHHHVSSDITDLSPTTVGLGNVPNVDATNASNITSGTLSNTRLTSNLSEIGNITKNNGDLIAVVAGAYAARTLTQVKADLSLNNVPNVDTTNASNITSGTLSNARLTTNLSQIGDITFNSGDIVYFNGTTLVNKSPNSYKTDLNLSKSDVGLGNVPNVDATNATNITTGTLSNARLSTNLSQIGNIIPTTGDYINFNGSAFVNIAPTAVKASLNLTKSDVGLGSVPNVDATNATNITTGTLSNARLTTNLSQIGGITFSTNDIVYYNGTTLINIAPASYKSLLSLTKSDVGLGNVPNVDTTNASNITTGTLPISVIPAGALERLVIVADQTARFALTTAQVQNGDTVKQNDTGTMYFIVDDTNLNNSTGYQVYTAGSATTVPYSGITSLPSSIQQLGSTTFSTNDVVYYNGSIVTNISPSSYKTILALTKSDVGLGNVTNSLQVINAGGAVSYAIGTNASKPVAGTIGRQYYSTDQGITYYDNGTSWAAKLPAYTGDVSSSQGGTTLTLATVNSNIGTFNNVTVNGKGLVTAASNVAYLTGNQTITLSGDFTGSGTTAITGTLATVNSNVGTFGSTTSVPVITVNGKGLVTAVSTAALTNSSVGLGNVTNSLQVINAGGAISHASGTNASKPTAGTLGRFYTSTDQGITYFDNGSTWAALLPAYTGDVSSSQGGTSLTLATVNSNIGTFNNVTVNGKGLVTAASNVAYLTSNQNITVSGDISGSGTTALTLTLPNVNANIGTFNNVTVNAKGQVTAASNTSYLTGNQTITLSGDFTGSGTTAITGTLATVNSNVGSFGSITSVPIITVNGKGLVTAVSTAALTNSSVGLGNVTNSLQVINAGGAVSLASGTNASRSAAGTTGRFYYSTDLGIISFDNGTTWNNILPAYTGDVTSSIGGTSLTLATVNSNVGTFNNVTVNGKGLVTAASNANYLVDPSNNGILVRTAQNTTGWRILSGTNNQITVTDGNGVAGNPTIGIASNPIIPGTGSMTLPSGTTAQRDTPTNGQVRWNTDLGYAEISDNGVYRPLGRVAQIITGTIPQTTGTTVLPYDNTVPQPTEGFQIWTDTITPYYTTSTIIVIYSVFAESSSSSAIVTSTLFKGTTLLAALSAYTGVSNTPMSVAVQKSFVSGTTSPITLTGRIGSSVNATTYVNRGNTETFGGGLNSSYIIMEFT